LDRTEADVADDFYSFEKALRELHKTEEELKKLVSEGEIRAFRDESSMKFKKEDIDRFKKALGADLPTHEAPTGELHEELFGDDTGSSSDDVGMVTQQISDSSFLEEATEAPPTKAARSSSRAARASKGGAPKAACTASAVRSAARRRADARSEDEGNGMRFCLILGMVVLLYASLVSFSAAQVSTTGMTEGWANFIGGFMKPGS